MHKSVCERALRNTQNAIVHSKRPVRVVISCVTTPTGQLLRQTVFRGTWSEEKQNHFVHPEKIAMPAMESSPYFKTSGKTLYWRSVEEPDFRLKIWAIPLLCCRLAFSLRVPFFIDEYKKITGQNVVNESFFTSKKISLQLYKYCPWHVESLKCTNVLQ